MDTNQHESEKRIRIKITIRIRKSAYAAMEIHKDSGRNKA